MFLFRQQSSAEEHGHGGVHIPGRCSSKNFRNQFIHPGFILTFVIVFFNFAISFMFELHQVDQHDCFFHIKEFRNEHWNSMTLFILRDVVFQLFRHYLQEILTSSGAFIFRYLLFHLLHAI